MTTAVRALIARCLPPLVAALTMAACSSVELPTKDESREVIARSRARFDSLATVIAPVARSLPEGYDVVTRVRSAMVNRMLKAFADARADDLRIAFPPTRPLLKEEKSVLGIRYTNLLDIDTGNVVLNLRTFRFERFANNRLDALLEIDGGGKIRASGRYTGVPAGASPDIELTLSERITFDVRLTDTGTVILRPVPKQLALKAKFSVKLLEWSIPWREDIPLQLTDLIKPLAVPVALRSEIPFPVPASTFGDSKLQFVPYLLSTQRSSVTVNGDAVEFKADVEFRKK
ncbi:MAG: hypothetical protein IPP94_02825 [Ignavibacteria bacterium]|nr:hypothetical protein [Ignavibacteria bacterium]